MNRRINKCITIYFNDLKKKISEKSTTLSIAELVQYIEEYPPLVLKSSDYEKRQRTKNIVPLYERCKAKRANGEQCTRRRKEKNTLCGTHIKGTPHGMMDIKDDNIHIDKVDVWIQEINGINYYIDNNNNIYDPQDVFQNKVNPRRIHKYERDEEGVYSIIGI